MPKLLQFIELLKDWGFELFKKLGKTIENWSDETAGMFRFPRNNGITEGFHRKMKLIQRRAMALEILKTIAYVSEFYVLNLLNNRVN